MNRVPPYILVVDDVEDAADALAELVNNWGYDATACYGGERALEAARARFPGAVLLDLAMPWMDGFGFTREFRSVPGCAAVPIVAVSGYADEAYRARALGAGIAHYLLKPADPARVKQLLAGILEPFSVPRGRSGRVERVDSVGNDVRVSRTLIRGTTRRIRGPVSCGDGGRS